MREFIARLNIAHYRARLETESDPTARETLCQLLAEQEAELERAIKAKAALNATKDIS
jgi:hypothetical protein